MSGRQAPMCGHAVACFERFRNMAYPSERMSSTKRWISSSGRRYRERIRLKISTEVSNSSETTSLAPVSVRGPISWMNLVRTTM